MTLLVQDYLRSGRTLAELYVDHAVLAKPHAGKVSFLYDQFRARRDDPLANQCRGLILREGTWDVVAYPFDRFYDHDDVHAAKVDWGTAFAELKLDGTLCIVYFDEQAGRWHVGTRQMTEAHGKLGGSDLTVADLVDLAVKDMGVGAAGLHELMEGIAADGEHTYSFELTAPENRVVCAYERRELTLIGVRRLSDHRELDPGVCARAIGLETPRVFPWRSLSEVLASVAHWSPAAREGVIVKDFAFNRVKVKTAQYLHAHHAIDSLGASWRAVAEAIQTGQAAALMELVPKDIGFRLLHLEIGIEQLVRSVESDYAMVQEIADMKRFAAEAGRLRWPAALFALKRGKVRSVREYLQKANPDVVLDLCRKLGWKELP